MRKLVFWVHLSAGVVTGAVILVMSVTGLLLAYKPQMVEWVGRAPFQTITEVHRWLGADRSLGRPITRACSIAFLFLMVSGLVLWWRGRVARFRWRLRGRARDFNWHNVAGIWAVVPLFVVVVTGVVISFPRGPGPRTAFRWWARYLHTGEAGGIAGQTVAAVACGAAVVLVWTGAAMAVRRALGGLSARRRLRACPTVEAEGVVALGENAGES